MRAANPERVASGEGCRLIVTSIEKMRETSESAARVEEEGEGGQMLKSSGKIAARNQLAWITTEASRSKSRDGESKAFPRE